MGKITNQLDEMWAVRVQDDRVTAARIAMHEAYYNLMDNNAKMQAIVDLGALNLVPTETKAALNKAWAALKVCQAALEAADILEALNWVGK